MFTRVLAWLCVLACTPCVRADLIPTEHVVNGTFSAGSTGWTLATNNPATNWLVSADPGFGLGAGPYARNGNANSSTYQRIFQEFTLPSLPQFSATLSWRDRFESALDWVDGSLEYRVALQRVVAGVPTGLLTEVFSTATNPTVVSAGPTNRGTTNNVAAFVTANLGETVRLSFELIDSGTIPDVAFDTVSFVTVFDTTSVPEPTSFLLVSLPALGFVVSRRKKSATSEGSINA